MSVNYDYDRFLKVLIETNGIKNALNYILKYMFIYNSNKIEGSRFTIWTLQMLMEKNVVTGTHTLDDVQETMNSFYTFDLVLESLGEKLNLEMIKLWHSSLMYRTRLYDMHLAGVFKKYGNKILGANFETVEPQEVEYRLSKLIDKYNNLSKPTMEDICRFHLEFEKIHPFQDGNGRIGRFIYLKQILENKFAFKYMKGESAMEYKKALGNCSEDTVKPLVDYIENQKDFIAEN
ncbi:Fic family protein [Clostridium perfringens]|uniref:Fic family protein n=1 Tax=Clostridium perfringens TaxID=1502 RepID=UPI00030D7225|nr:Fic family protein [Clostridium perfringens]ELC8395540.1 Fic family protein [Clostridium perfringens]MCX0392339.1 Fic family protein [Clostridium perfringens]MDK0693401.1 Fic family protein [Clostridium perfringens]PWX10297.1 cell filamentation protein Fic [Clostridium perfringens]STB60816.1 Fic family protein [Clostridium perfringens]